MMEVANNKLTQVSNYKSDIWLEIDSFLDNINGKVDNILNYTKQEQEQLEALIKILKDIKKLIDSWKNVGNSIPYTMFYFSYNKLDDRLKKSFSEIYWDIITKVWIFRIERCLTERLPSWRLDKWSIQAEISNILKVNPLFDFWQFNSEEVLNLVEKIAK